MILLHNRNFARAKAQNGQLPMRYCLAILLIVWTTGASALRCEHESVYLREAAAVFVGRLVTFHTNVDRSEILLHY